MTKHWFYTIAFLTSTLQGSEMVVLTPEQFTPQIREHVINNIKKWEKRSSYACQSGIAKCLTSLMKESEQASEAWFQNIDALNIASTYVNGFLDDYLIQSSLGEIKKLQEIADSADTKQKAKLYARTLCITKLVEMMNVIMPDVLMPEVQEILEHNKKYAHDNNPDTIRVINERRNNAYSQVQIQFIQINEHFANNQETRNLILGFVLALPFVVYGVPISAPQKTVAISTLTKDHFTAHLRQRIADYIYVWSKTASDIPENGITTSIRDLSHQAQRNIDALFENLEALDIASSYVKGLLSDNQVQSALRYTDKHKASNIPELCYKAKCIKRSIYLIKLEQTIKLLNPTIIETEVDSLIERINQLSKNKIKADELKQTYRQVQRQFIEINSHIPANETTRNAILGLALALPFVFYDVPLQKSMQTTTSTSTRTSSTTSSQAN